MMAVPLERAARLSAGLVASVAAQQLQGLLDAVASGQPMLLDQLPHSAST
jgi:hypothetical protein